MSQRHRIAAVADVPPGTGIEAVAAGRMIAVFNVDGEFHAMDGVCPHSGGPIGQGALSGCIVTCPWHGWQFDVTTGTHQLNANLHHPVFPVTVEGDDVYVELPDESA